MTEPKKQPLIEIAGIVKQYPGVRAIDGVSLELYPGRVHALVGENGAGKSTLIKVLSGIVRPDGGDVRVHGQRVAIDTPVRARELGIVTIHQHSHLLPTLTLSENHALRNDYLGTPAIAWGAIRKRADTVLKDNSVSTLPIGPERRASSLSVVEKQVVEIAYALGANPKLLILDEPTAVLPHTEAERLFEEMRKFAAAGGCALFVSHRLEEVFAIANDITVMRDGRIVSQMTASETDAAGVIRAMVGRTIAMDTTAGSPPSGDTAPALRVTNLTDSSNAFRNISLQVRPGEVYGIYGLVGAGQTELCDALFGLRDVSAGSVELGSNAVTGHSPMRRVGSRLGYVPSDRLTQGVFSQLSVGENMGISSLRKRTRAGLLALRKERLAVREQIQRLSVKTTGPQQNIAQLSGGNQQKVMLGRWLETEPAVLMLSEPTQGVDVGAKSEIHRIVDDLAQSGVAVLLVSSEIPELRRLAHRIGVMREGNLVAELATQDAADEQLLELALPESAAARGEAAKTIEPAKKPLLARATRHLFALREAGLAVAILLAVILFSFTTPTFMTWGNMRDLMLNNAILLIGALGVSLVIIAGGIDISIGGILALSAVAAGKADLAGWPTPAIVAVGVLTGVVLGAMNGLLTWSARVDAIIITLGTFFIFRGALPLAMDERWLLNLSDRITGLGQGNVHGVPLLLLIAVGTLVITHMFLRYTVAGRRLYAYGADSADAAYVGIYPRHVIPLAFTLCGLLVGIAGLLQAGRFGQVQTNAGGGFELRAIAAAVIGGTHSSGGRGSAFGVLLGTLFMGIVSNILVLMNVSAYWERAIIGVLILAVAGTDMLITARQERRA